MSERGTDRWGPVVLALLTAALLACQTREPQASGEPTSPSLEAHQSGAEPARPTQTTERPVSEVPAAPEAPALPPGFAPATLRQEELRGIAMDSLNRGDLNRAIAALIALMETPEMSDLKASGMLLLADLYHQESGGERALAVLEQLMAEAPEMAEFEFVLGRTLGDLERSEEAEAHLRRAIDLNPEFLQSYLHLGSLLVAQGREDAAAPVYAAYEAALASLLREVGDPATDLSRRLAILESLGTANPDARITNTLVHLLGEDSVVINGAAIQVLALVGTEVAVPALAAYARQTPHDELRVAAEQAAGAIGRR